MPRPFTIFLIAKTISALGSQITIVALPLTAILILHATPLQMSLLTGASALTGLLFGLIAGLAIDHLPKRLVLIAANAAAALIFAATSITAAIHLLNIPLLLATTFAAATIATAGLALILATFIASTRKTLFAPPQHPQPATP